MTTRRPSWKTIAKKQIGRTAIFRGGDGPFAFVTPCREVVFTLFQTRAEAEKLKVKIDKVACGGECWRGTHYIVDLEEGI